MARVLLIAAIFAAIWSTAHCAEKPEFKWSCKKPSIQFNAKLAGARNPRGKQYPVGTLSVCLLAGDSKPTLTTPYLAFKQ
jgi:hypothetical protein